MSRLILTNRDLENLTAVRFECLMIPINRELEFSYLAKMKGLRVLELSGDDVTTEQLESLAKLNFLEYLALHDQIYVPEPQRSNLIRAFEGREPWFYDYPAK